MATTLNRNGNNGRVRTLTRKTSTIVNRDAIAEYLETVDPLALTLYIGSEEIAMPIQIIEYSSGSLGLQTNFRGKIGGHNAVGNWNITFSGTKLNK